MIIYIRQGEAHRKERREKQRKEGGGARGSGERKGEGRTKRGVRDGRKEKTSWRERETQNAFLIIAVSHT